MPSGWSEKAQAAAKERVQSVLRGRGYEIRRLAPPVEPEYAPFHHAADEIIARHNAQTVETVAALRAKYAAPVFGMVRVWELVEMLARCVDPTDGRLFCTSQQIHVLQMLRAMEADGVDDPDLVLAALIHDCGKVLGLTGENWANVSCMNHPIGNYEPGVGLENVTMQWNHDEFAYSRFVGHVPEHVAWLIRFHSIDIDECAPLMDERDRELCDRYLRAFTHYDHETKTPYVLPERTIDEYRDIVEDAFPKPISF